MTSIFLQLRKSQNVLNFCSHLFENQLRYMYRVTLKRWSLRSLRCRNGISKNSGETLSSITQGKQHNAIFVTQTIPLGRIILSIGEAYSWNK